MSSPRSIHPLSLPFLLPRRSRLLLRKIIVANNCDAIVAAASKRELSSTPAAREAEEERAASGSSVQGSLIRKVAAADLPRGIKHKDVWPAGEKSRGLLYRPFRQNDAYDNSHKWVSSLDYRSQALNEALAPEEDAKVPQFNKLLGLEKEQIQGPRPKSFESFYELYSKMYYPAFEEKAKTPRAVDSDNMGRDEATTKNTEDLIDEYKSLRARTPSIPKKVLLINLIDPLLPPSMRANASSPRSSVELDDSFHPRIHLSSLDVPWPSLVRAHGEEQLEETDPAIQKADEEFEESITQAQLSRLLDIINYAGANKVDILWELLRARREKAMLWIVRRLVDASPSAEASGIPYDIWRATATFESTAADTTSKQNPAVDVMSTTWSKSQSREILRRRVGVGVVLRSVAYMLKYGHLSVEENLAIQEIKRTKVAGEEQRTDQEEMELLSLLKLPSVTAEAQPRTPEDIFSYAVLLLAYLHSHDHVPASVYSERHPVPHSMHHQVIRRMMEAAESSYLLDLGFKVSTKVDKEDIDWAGWLELVITIANERGLSAAACEIITHLPPVFKFLPDDICLQNRQGKASNRPGFLMRLWRGSSAGGVEESEQEQNKVILSRSVAVHAVEGLLATGAYDGIYPANQTERIIRYMQSIAAKSGGIDGNLASRFLQTPFINLRSQSAVKLLNLQINGSWGLQFYYELLIGAIERLDRSYVIRVWRQLEGLLVDSGRSEPHPFLGRRHSGAFRPLQGVAREDVFRHSLHVLSSLLHYMRSHTMDQPHLMRHIILTAVTPKHLIHPPILNPLLSYAAEVNEPQFVGYLLTVVPNPVHGTTLSTLINFFLRVDKPEIAKIFLQRKRDVRAPMHDGFDFGLLVNNAFRRSFDEGMTLMYRAIRDLYKQSGEEMPEDVKQRFVFSEGVELPKLPESRAAITIGDVAWISMLNAAVDRQDYNLVILALSGLGLDLTDPDVAMKMGTLVFTILLKGVVNRKCAWTGMRMWKTYCAAPRPMKGSEAMLKGPDAQRSIAGILEFEALQREASLPILTPGKLSRGSEVATDVTDSKFVLTDSRPQRDMGLVVPNVITLTTIVNQALKERDLIERSRFVLNKNIVDRTAEEDKVLADVWRLTTMEGGLQGWTTVLTWAKRMWKAMGLADEEWRRLDPHFKEEVGAAPKPKPVSKTFMRRIRLEHWREEQSSSPPVVDVSEKTIEEVDSVKDDNVKKDDTTVENTEVKPKKTRGCKNKAEKAGEELEKSKPKEEPTKRKKRGRKSKAELAREAEEAKKLEEALAKDREEKEKSKSKKS